MKPAKIQPLDEDSVLFRGLGISLLIHFLILAFFTIRTAFFTPEQIDFSQAVRVDMVGLPEKLQELPPPAKEASKPALPEKAKEAPAPTPKPVEKVVEKTPPPAPKADDGVNLEKVKSKQKNALDKLKALAALDKIKEDVAVEAKNDAKGKVEKAVAAQVKGNVINSGNSLTGLDKLQHDSFISDLDTHIKKNWQLPQWLANRDYKAQVLLQFDSRGNILSRKIVKSSGNPSYDEEVLATIDRSAPFPAPPEKLAAYVSDTGIRIGFPE